MSSVRNVLFVMCDQLRRDHLSCYGGRVHTPHLDSLAARGVRFDNAFVQSGVCGPSRMSFYTGRYMSSHGATWNRVPLSAAELTLGDYLRAAGRVATLAGKTHVLPDYEALDRVDSSPTRQSVGAAPVVRQAALAVCCAGAVACRLSRRRRRSDSARR